MKNVICFGIGVALGAVASVLCVKRHYQKLAEEVIEEIRELYHKKTASKELAEKNSEAKKAFFNDISDEKVPENEAKVTQLTQKNAELERFESLREPYVQSHNVFSNPPDDEDLSGLDDFEDDPYEFEVDQTGPSDDISEPFEISEEEFSSEKLFYDKVILFYYNDGITVVEETDEIVEALEDLIGPDILPNAMDKFGWDPKENDAVYVRNNNRSTDYGILFTGTDFVQEEEPD